ncbi:MAG: NADP-dependent oxidoreductase [Bacteroidetes bacterium]|nr:NADP-dependent oxidoreductase [Bacteroidota bacterium]
MNTQIKLASRPFGLPNRDNWQIESNPVSQPGKGEMLVKIIYVSLDPAMRGWMNDAKSYIPPVQIGAVMRAGTIGQVVSSDLEKFSPGDFVVGNMGVQQYALSDGKGVMKIQPGLAPLTAYLGVLGMTGITAYFGLLDICDPQPGETVVVSGAAGAVGSVVGQIAKIKGCRAVGIAGGAEKCKYLIEELGYDEAIDYKNEPLRAALKRTCPNGIDVYFDNVGGEMLDTVLTRINLKARISICGAISQYNSTEAVKGPANYLSLLVNRAKMEGFIVFDYAKRYMEAITQMAQWYSQGKLKSREQIEEGIENFPEVLLKLFSGEKKGKLILQVNDLD